MVKIIALVGLLVGCISAKDNIYEQNCVACHKKLSFELEDVFFRYLLKYSDEVSVKSALVDFLKQPNYDTSVMVKEYINSFGLKQQNTLSDAQLQEAVDIYWQKYTVFGKLK